MLRLIFGHPGKLHYPCRAGGIVVRPVMNLPGERRRQRIAPTQSQMIIMRADHDPLVFQFGVISG